MQYAVTQIVCSKINKNITSLIYQIKLNIHNLLILRVKLAYEFTTQGKHIIKDVFQAKHLQEQDVDTNFKVDCLKQWRINSSIYCFSKQMIYHYANAYDRFIWQR